MGWGKPSIKSGIEKNVLCGFLDDLKILGNSGL